MDIFLVRHGEAASSWGESPDPGLSDLGHQEAERAAQELLPLLSADVQLISSPLARAQETAEPLARLLAKPVEIDRVFREVPSPVPLSERQQWLRTFMQQDWSEQEGEIVQWREAAIERLMACDQPTAVFSHFLVINAVVSWVEGTSGILRFLPGNGSITHLRKHGEKLELVSLGAELETVVN